MDEGFLVIYLETESVSGNRGYKSGKGLRPTPGITPLNCDRELGSRSPTDSRCGLPSQEVDMVSDMESAYYRFSIKEEVYSCSSYFFTLWFIWTNKPRLLYKGFTATTGQTRCRCVWCKSPTWIAYDFQIRHQQVLHDIRSSHLWQNSPHICESTW